MSENQVLKKFEARVKSVGGQIRELGIDGFPQYLVILPGGHIGFVDIGDNDKKMYNPRYNRIHDLRQLGCAACKIETEQHFNRALNYILSDAGKDPCWQAYKDYLAEFRGRGKGDVVE